MSDITNPYLVGEPVADRANFFGRQDAADWVELQIAAKARVLIISGQSYIGKTSFVRHIDTLQPGPRFKLLISLSDIVHRLTPDAPQRWEQSKDSPAPAIEMLLEPFIAEIIAQLVQQQLLTPTQAAAPFYPTATTIREIFTQVSPNFEQPLLFFYIDDLHQLITEDMALLATFLSIFLPILDECPSLYLIFTIQENQLADLRHPLLNTAPTFHLSPLSPDASINMITIPVTNILRFDYGITRRIAEMNSHHPYYLALFCGTLLDRQIHDGWVNQRNFDATLAQILAEPIEPFKEMWDTSNWSERAVLSGMAGMQGLHGPVMQQEVIRYLQNLDKNTIPAVVVEALKTLADRGILAPMGAISYRFHVELFRYWLREHTEPAEILGYVEWSRLATQLNSKAVQDKAIAPPIAARGSSGRGRRGLVGTILLLIVSLLCLFVFAAFFAAQYLGTPLPLLSTPTVAPLVVFEQEQPQNATTQTQTEPQATPPPLEPAATPTPTPALVMARTLPALTYMGKDIDQAWRIYVMNADGSEATPLSEDGLDDTTPVWSPDGSKIALVSRRDGNREIYIMDVESKTAVNVTRHPADDWTPAWSPDGTQLAFASIRTGRWEIFVLDTACVEAPESCRNNLSQLTADGSGNISPIWSPDGSRFAFNSKRSGNWDIYTMAADGSDVRQVTTAGDNDLSPAWSPDGSRIAFESNRTGNVEIYVIDSNGAGPVQNITNLPFADDHGPTWSPDGQTIVFYSNREGNWDIFSTTLDGQLIFNLTQTPGRDEQTPAWRP